MTPQVRGTWRIVLPLGPGLGAKVCAVSRGLGDLDFKEPAPLISAEPDVTATALQPGVDTCVVYGSDGLWGVLTDQDAVDIVDMVCADVSGGGGRREVLGRGGCCHMCAGQGGVPCQRGIVLGRMRVLCTSRSGKPAHCTL